MDDLKSISWNKIKLVGGGAVGGAFVLAAIGFGWAGWVFESKAEEMAQQAIVDRLVPICVAQFLNDPQNEQKLARLEQAEYLEQTTFVEEQGWATMPGAKTPNSEVASRCVREIRFASPG